MHDLRLTALLFDLVEARSRRDALSGSTNAFGQQALDVVEDITTWLISTSLPAPPPRDG